MKGLRLGVTVTVVLTIHGFAGWWLAVDPFKYSPPHRRQVETSVASFNVLKSQKREQKINKQIPTKPNNVLPLISSSQIAPVVAETIVAAPTDAAGIVRWKDNSFFTIDEVDTPALPVGDWVINFSVWPTGRSPAIVVEMWISAEGKLEHWELVSETPNREMIETSLRNLEDTPINPALRFGKRVASFRRVEIIVDVDP